MHRRLRIVRDSTRRVNSALGGGKVGLMATPKEVAQWMVVQLEEGDRLLQVEAVTAIEKLFGSEFVYLSDIGEKALAGVFYRAL